LKGALKMFPPNYKYFFITVVFLSFMITVYFQGWGSQRGYLILGLITTLATYLYYFDTIKRK
jgi:hypothetical protein